MKLNLCLILLLLVNCSEKSTDPLKASSPTLRTNGTTIVDSSGNEVVLTGVSFGNEVWSNPLPYTHHTEEDFVRVKEMGMNAIRFYMNYKTFEDDVSPYQYKNSGWEWLDLNIARAKKHGIYLILNIHVPQGGYQSNGDGDRLWLITENQNRLKALWKEIANRYANEPIIAGYDLLNEPHPTQAKDQLSTLMQQITDAIRTVDKNHIISVERANAVNNKYDNDADLNFYKINDTNIIYTFHIYSPIEYTHQFASWLGWGDGGKYPDESKLVITGAINWYSATFNNPVAVTGTTDWIFYEGEKYKITDSKISLGKLALVGEKINDKIYFDDLILKEFDANGAFVRDVVTWQPSTEDTFYFWSQNNSGQAGIENSIGRTDLFSYSISSTTSDANISLDRTRFVPKQGYYYQASGWMKGVGLSSGARAQVRLDFETTSDPVLARNKQALEKEINQYVAWGKKNNVPIYLGEYGVISNCFENNKGGITWVGDMLEILKANKIHSTYHAYHEDNFGIYPGYGTLPDPSTARLELINLFKQKLK
ncbi:MAG: glycoside hydrolase family 5 protein [Cyclobacteriaceae bacterium]